jgi:hypothetical protein
MAIYLGRCKDGDLVQFHCASVPTQESHGHLYTAVIGPFHSRLAAHYFARHGRDDPNLRSAADAERLARADPRMDAALVEESLTDEERAIADECAAEDLSRPVMPAFPQPPIPIQGESSCPIGLKTN